MPYASYPMKNPKSYFTLCRIKVSLFAACSAATGFLVSQHNKTIGFILPASAVFMLACGSSALNQYQDRNIDVRMERTRRRPLPSGALAPHRALTVSLTLMTAGLLLLVLNGGVIPAALGLFAVFWYNGVYAFLKRRTAFASVPGALVGAASPAIGWTSAGGTLSDPGIIALCFLFFLWQIPHFWLLILRYGEEYEKANLPSLTQVLSRAQIIRVTFTWIFATAAASLSLPLYGVAKSPVVTFSLIPVALWVVWNGARLLRDLPARPRRQEPGAPLITRHLVPVARNCGRRVCLSPVSTFNGLNVYIFVVMTLLSFDRIFPIP